MLLSANKNWFFSFFKISNTEMTAPIVTIIIIFLLLLLHLVIILNYQVPDALLFLPYTLSLFHIHHLTSHLLRMQTHIWKMPSLTYTIAHTHTREHIHIHAHTHTYILLHLTHCHWFSSDTEVCRNCLN